MEIDTKLSQQISQVGQEPLYDNYCKQLLSNKHILAWIMKECTTEYHDLPIDDIATKYIEGEPSVSTINLTTGDTVTGMPNEDIGINEGKIVYDIRYKAICPTEDGFIDLIINIEAQNQYNPGYPLVRRGIYYSSRMISGQYGTSFTKAEYGKLKKVYSIWICRNVPKKLQNSITSYDLKETNHVGHVKEKKAHYDLMSVVMVYLGSAGSGQDSKLLTMLNAALSSNVNADKKLDILANEYHIPKTETLEKEVRLMCNLSQGVKEEGRQEGLQEGRQEGLQEGRQEGLVAAVVNIMNSLKVSIGEALTIAGIPEAERDTYAANVAKLMK
ncbi:MAG: PD-(D/E)XK nuclease family transposase [Defluviitaleaceae bacterium]|nr:PD-(D/E)XK nuclease family transposase [Defluviitaleaceae bacterium]